MIWLIIGIIAMIILIIYIWRENLWVGIVECILMSTVALVMGSLTILLVCIISSGVVSNGDAFEFEQVEDIPIIALKDNQNIEGHFYLAGGYVNEELYYYYATETEFGYKTEKIKADNTYIKYTDEQPHIERYEGDFAETWRYLWGFPMCVDRYIIYCPEGTVDETFLIDLE